MTASPTRWEVQGGTSASFVGINHVRQQQREAAAAASPTRSWLAGITPAAAGHPLYGAAQAMVLGPPPQHAGQPLQHLWQQSQLLQFASQQGVQPQPPVQLPPRGAASEPQKPKRVTNAYMLFCKATSEAPPTSGRKLSRLEWATEKSLLWGGLSQEAKAPYQQMADQDRMRYEAEMRAYQVAMAAYKAGQ